MTDNHPPSLFDIVAAELRTLGLTITVRPGEYCVNFRSGTEATAYSTDELQDALERGRAMAAAREAEPTGRKQAPIIRREWRGTMSAQAQRRRTIRAHNHRMWGRAIKKQRAEG